MFDLKDNKVIVKPEFLLIPEFKKVWRADNSRSKKRALTEFSYIFFVADYKSPYKKSYYSDELEDMVKSDIIGDIKWKVPERVSNAIATYERLQKTKTLKTLETAIDSLEKVKNYLTDFSLEGLDSKERSLAISGLLNNIEKLPKVLSTIENAKDKVEKELSIATKNIRGKGELGLRENPDSILKKIKRRK